MWALDILVSFGCEPVVCVVPPGYAARARSILSGRDVPVAEGGASRQASVASGLDLVRTETVIVHDAARPFLTEAMLRAVLAPLTDHDGAVTGLPVAETIKRVLAGEVMETVERSDLWRSQTPQAFRTETLKRAHVRASRDGFTGTDDAQLIERYGGTIAVVKGDPRNMKLTYPEDFALAELVAAGMKGPR